MRLRSLIGAASRLHAAPPNRPRRMVPIHLHLTLSATMERTRATLDKGCHLAKTMSPVGHPPGCCPTTLPDSPRRGPVSAAAHSRRGREAAEAEQRSGPTQFANQLLTKMHGRSEYTRTVTDVSSLMPSKKGLSRTQTDIPGHSPAGLGPGPFGVGIRVPSPAPSSAQSGKTLVCHLEGGTETGPASSARALGGKALVHV
jgi:hypothetical protein